MDSTQLKTYLAHGGKLKDIIYENGFKKVIETYGAKQFIADENSANIINIYGIQNFIMAYELANNIEYYDREKMSKYLRSCCLFLIINKKISAIEIKMFLKKKTIKGLEYAYTYTNNKDVTFLAVKKDKGEKISRNTITNLDYVDNKGNSYESKIYTLKYKLFNSITKELKKAKTGIEIDQAEIKILCSANFDARCITNDVKSKDITSESEDNNPENADSKSESEDSGHGKVKIEDVKFKSDKDIPSELEEQVMLRVAQMEKKLYDYVNGHNNEVYTQLCDMRTELRQDVMDMCRTYLEEHGEKINKRFKNIYKYQCDQVQEFYVEKNNVLQRMYDGIMKRLDQMDTTETVKSILGHLQKENQRNHSAGQTMINVFNFVCDKIPDTLCNAISNVPYFEEAAAGIKSMIKNLTSVDTKKSEDIKPLFVSQPLTMPPILPPLYTAVLNKFAEEDEEEESQTISITEYEQSQLQPATNGKPLKDWVDQLTESERNNMYDSYVYIHRDDLYSTDEVFTVKAPLGIFLIMANKGINYQAEIKMTETCKELYQFLDLCDRKEIFKYVHPTIWNDIIDRFNQYKHEKTPQVYKYRYLAQVKLSPNLQFKDFFEFHEFRTGLSDYKSCFSNRPEYYIEGDKIELISYKRSDKDVRYHIWYRILNDHDVFKDPLAFEYFEYYESLFGLIKLHIPEDIKERLNCNHHHVYDYKQVGYFQTVWDWGKKPYK